LTFPIIDHDDLEFLSPSLYLSGIRDDDAHFREVMERIYAPLAARGEYPYNLWRISTGAFYQASMMRRVLGDTSQMTAVEIGSGNGMKAMSWATAFKHYIGVDLNESTVQRCSRLCKEFGIANAEFHVANAVEFVRSFPEEVDLLILYSVIEHLTLDERQEILSLAHKVYQSGGAVMIEETPNRLIKFDGHSYHLPFVQWLPPDLMQLYVERFSHRKDLIETLHPTDRTPLYRAGIGVSYHEFDLFWPDFNNVGIIQDGYSIESMNTDPVTADDLHLLDYFSAAKTPAHRLFSKNQLSCVLRSGKTVDSGKAARLPISDLAHGANLTSGNADGLPVAWLPPQGSLTIPPGEGHVLINFFGKLAGSLTVKDEQGLVQSYPLEALSKARLPTWHESTTLALPPISGEMRVMVTEPNLITDAIRVL